MGSPRLREVVLDQEVFSKRGDPVNRWDLVKWGLTAGFSLNRSNVVEAVGEGPKRGLTECSKRVSQIRLVDEAIPVLIHDGECLEAQEEGREHREWESCWPLQRLEYPPPPPPPPTELDGNRALGALPGMGPRGPHPAREQQPSF